MRTSRGGAALASEALFRVPLGLSAHGLAESGERAFGVLRDMLRL